MCDRGIQSTLNLRGETFLAAAAGPSESGTDGNKYNVILNNHTLVRRRRVSGLMTENLGPGRSLSWMSVRTAGATLPALDSVSSWALTERHALHHDDMEPLSDGSQLDPLEKN